MGQFLTSVRDGISTDDIIGGVLKPISFALIIGSIACYKGLNTEGGTVGVGRATTTAVVTASIVVIIADFSWLEQSSISSECQLFKVLKELCL